MSLVVKGMHCGGCAKHVEQALRALSGVTACTVQFKQGTAEVSYVASQVTVQKLVEEIEKAGYQAEPPKAATNVDREKGKEEQKQDKPSEQDQKRGEEKPSKDGRPHARGGKPGG